VDARRARGQERHAPHDRRRADERGALSGLRIAFFGLPLAAHLLAEDGHEVVWAALSRPGMPGERRVRRRLAAAGVGVLRPSELRADVGSRLRALAPDLIVSWFWTRKLSPAVLAAGRLGALGVHPSLLPRHRGPDPYFWAIECGDAETGVTAHLLDAEYDTGAILAQRRLPIDPAWNAWQLARALDRPSLALLRDVVRAYAEGRPPSPVPQDDGAATSAPFPDDELLALRWTEPAESIARRVRAAAPWPGATTSLGEEPIVLTHVVPTSRYPRALAPGEAAVRVDGVAVVRAADDAVELRAGRRADDESPLGAAELARLVEAARA
jgi:methionyl-tRNA formyltransferase